MLRTRDADEPARAHRRRRRRSTQLRAMIVDGPRRVRARRPSRSTPSTSCRPPATTATCASARSPRATLQLIRAAKARAALHGRDFVLPDDIDALAVAVLGHRLVPTSRALGHHHQDSSALIEEIVLRIVSETAVPLGNQKRS